MGENFPRQESIPKERKTRAEPKIITVGRALPAAGVVAAAAWVGVAVGVPAPVTGDMVKVGVGVAVGTVIN